MLITDVHFSGWPEELLLGNRDVGDKLTFLDDFLADGRAFVERVFEDWLAPWHTYFWRIPGVEQTVSGRCSPITGSF